MLRFAVFRPWLKFRSAFPLKTHYVFTIGLTGVAMGVLTFAQTPVVRLDFGSSAAPASEMVIDPATDIAFPTTLRIPSRFPLPQYTLLGVGVRRVSFLGIKVYSVGFFADIASVPPINRSASFEEKIRHIVEHSSCVLRIIPTRSTSYSHLRDGFMRALQSRMILQKSRGLLTAAEEAEAAYPLLKFKSIFPNTPLTKNTPMDVVLTHPGDPMALSQSIGTHKRQLILRDLGSISNDWISKEFMLAYFEEPGISPSLKQSVEERLRNFGN